jgi:hypothetical protein
LRKSVIARTAIAPKRTARGDDHEQ